MNLLDQVAQDLKALLSNDSKYVRPWTPPMEERARANEESADDTPPTCAYIGYDGSCGFANGGSQAYVVNARNNVSVRATVRVYWRQGINSGQYDSVVEIPAGSRVYLGCTDSGAIPVIDYTYTVVGCQIV